MPRGLPAAELAALGPGRRRARRDLVLGRRLRRLPRRGQGRGRRPAEARRRAGARDALRHLRGAEHLERPRRRHRDMDRRRSRERDAARHRARRRQHLYPAFPYTSYARMKPADVADLRAYLATLPAVAGRQPGHDLKFPYSFRRGLGLWQLAFLDSGPVVDARRRRPGGGPRAVPGRGPGPLRRVPHRRGTSPARSTLARWLAGAPNPTGKGRVPNITSGEGGLATGAPRTSPPSSRPASPPTTTRSAAPWSRCRRTWRCSRPRTARRSRAYLKAVPPLASAR